MPFGLPCDHVVPSSRLIQPPVGTTVWPSAVLVGDYYLTCMFAPLVRQFARVVS